MISNKTLNTSQSPAWRTDEFGILVKASEEVLAYLRIVQLGWTYSCEGDPMIETRLINAVGFAIETGATAKHRVSHKRLLESCVPKRDALYDFFRELRVIVSAVTNSALTQASFSKRWTMPN